MKQYVLYVADEWLNTHSLHMVAVCDAMSACLRMARKYARLIDEPLAPLDEAYLQEHYQTQLRTSNFQIVEATLNELCD